MHGGDISEVQNDLFSLVIAKQSDKATFESKSIIAVTEEVYTMFVFFNHQQNVINNIRNSKSRHNICLHEQVNGGKNKHVLNYRRCGNEELSNYEL